KNVAVNLDHLFCRHTSARVQIINVLRNEQELVRALGKSCNCFMRSVRSRIADVPPPFAVPVPNQLRIARERFRCRKFCLIKIPPVTVLSTKSRDATFSRNARAGQNEDTHKLKIEKKRRFPNHTAHTSLLRRLPLPTHAGLATLAP